MSPFHCEFNINQSQYEQLALIIYHNSRYFIALSETNVLSNTSIQVQPPPRPYLFTTDRLVTSIVKENINGCFFFLSLRISCTCIHWIPVLVGTGLPVQQDDCSKQILLKITKKS